MQDYPERIFGWLFFLTGVRKVKGCWIFLLPGLIGLEYSVANEPAWSSLHDRVYSGQPLDLLPEEAAGDRVIRRFELLENNEGPISFSNSPSFLDLSYLSLSANGQKIVAMGNLVRGGVGSAQYVQAVRTVLVTWAPASDWPEWAQRDPSGYHHPVEAGIYGVERNAAGEIMEFDYVGSSTCRVHIPWRPTVGPDGGPYPFNGHAVEVTVPFVESVMLPGEYVVLISYNTQSVGGSPIGEQGPYNGLNYGLRKGDPTSGSDPDPGSLVQVSSEGWNYSASWAGLGSIMTEVVSRGGERMEEVPLQAPPGAGGSITALYDGEGLVEQAFVKLLPRPITLSASQQERIYGDSMVLDDRAFTVLDLDGDGILPNGEVVDAVILNSVSGIAADISANAGLYVDEIEITGQEGSNGFNAANYDLAYVGGDLGVHRRAVTLSASQQERIYGDSMVLDDRAFTVLDLDGDGILPNGEVVDAVILNSVSGIAADISANAGLYVDEIEITGQEGSNGFNAANYDLLSLGGDLLVRPAPVEIDLGARWAFRCGRGRGLWGQAQQSGLPVEFQYDGVDAIPETLGEHAYRVAILDPNYVATEETGSFTVVERTYEVWRTRFLAEEDSSGPEDDPDRDGISNLLEYALDTDPLAVNAVAPVIVEQDVGFSGLVAKELFGVSLVLETSSDLNSWQEIAPQWVTAGQIREWRWVSPGRGRLFVRLRVDR